MDESIAQQGAGPEHPLARAWATITAEDLRDHVGWLADDERAGRNAGEPGCEAAAEWIAEQFADMGLEAVGDEGGYLQRFEFSVRGARRQKTTTSNVVGLWRGGDPELSKEVVVLGAHYDHVGTAESFDSGRIGRERDGDSIWNGADDNASGTSVLIEVAQAFALSGARPARSLVFVAFSAEEHGLFGSAHFAQHPLGPGPVVAMVNMDMVGRNPGRRIEMAATGSLENDVWSRLIEAARPAAPSLDFTLQSASRPDSDHASFIDQGIPATFIFTGMHDDYHRVSDHADRLAYDQMEEIGKFATALAWNAANCTERLVFARPTFQPRGQKRLGIGGDGAVGAARMKELGCDGQGGFEVKELAPDGVGAKAGLREGDVILSIRGRELSADDPATSLRRLITGSPRGEDVPIVVRRGDETLTLTARWE